MCARCEKAQKLVNELAAATNKREWDLGWRLLGEIEPIIDSPSFELISSLFWKMRAQTKQLQAVSN